jgi:hypothetical protein
MPDNLLDQHKNVLIDDITAYFNGLEKENFGFSNILSNRLITDAVILKSKEFILIGAILKDVISDFGIYKEHMNTKKVIIEFKKYISEITSDEFKLIPEEIIKGYENFYNFLLENIDLPNEHYTEAIRFTELTTQFSLEFFKKELDDNAMPPNLDVLIFGVINEIKRSMRNLGFNTKILMLRLVLTFYARMHDYFRFLLTSELKSDRWEVLFKEYKAKLISNIKIYSNGDSYINKSTDFLYEICKEWRFMYLRLLELPKGSPIEKEVVIPPDIKKELDEIVTNLIKDKLSDKK